jgi:hypothetical protein
MVFAGVGAGINELTSLAAASEMAPTRKRGLYVAVLVATIIPFAPSVLYGQLIAQAASWRFVGLFCGLWAFTGFILTAVFYFPPPRVNSRGLTRREILAQIDYVGGVLSISGLVLFMMGLQWGAEQVSFPPTPPPLFQISGISRPTRLQYPWSSAHTLVPFVLGIVLITAFVIWEGYGAKYPMFPPRLKKNPRILAMTLVITFISGSNFFSVIMFWPTQSYNVYGHDPWAIGVRNIALGFPILGGACIVLALLSYTRGHIRELMVVSCCFMTAGSYLVRQRLFLNFANFVGDRWWCHGCSQS